MPSKPTKEFCTVNTHKFIEQILLLEKLWRHNSNLLQLFRGLWQNILLSKPWLQFPHISTWSHKTRITAWLLQRLNFNLDKKKTILNHPLRSPTLGDEVVIAPNASKGNNARRRGHVEWDQGRRRRAGLFRNWAKTCETKRFHRWEGARARIQKLIKGLPLLALEGFGCWMKSTSCGVTYC